MFRLRKATSSMNNQQQLNMKYLLFDLAVACAIVASVLTAGRGFSDKRGPSLGVNGNDANTPPSGHCVEGVEDAPEPMFGIGDIVEVYEPNIHPNYAFHAKIANVYVNKDNRCSDETNSTGDSSVQYDVRVGFGSATYQKINASSIRPMMPFEPKTRAACDDGRALNTKLVPCTVEFHVANAKKFFGEGSNQQDQPWLYSVSSLEEVTGEVIKRNIPVTRIRRIVREPCEDEDEADGIQDASATRRTQEVPQVKKIPATSPVIPLQTSNTEGDSSEEDTFPVGSIIEIYGPGGYFAFPATVIGVNHGMNEHQDPSLAKKYELTHGITHAHMKNIDPQFVHPYQVYQVGQKAQCNVGKKHRIIMVPCTVMSSIETTESDGGIVYQVSAKMVDRDVDHVLFLPRLRVQRRIKERGPATSGRSR